MLSAQTKALGTQFITEITLFTFKPLKFSFCSSSTCNLKEIGFYQRRDRGGTFSRSNSRHPVSIVIHAYGDVFHEKILPQIHSFTRSECHSGIFPKKNIQAHQHAPHVQQANNKGGSS